MCFYPLRFVIICVTIEELLYRVVLDGLSLLRLYEEKVYVSSDWGLRKEGRVFVANRFDDD